MRRFILIQLPLIAAVTMGVSSCPDMSSKPDPFPVAGQACHFPHDQIATITSPVLTLPLKVFIDPEYSKGQREDIREMAEQWNAFGRASLGLTFFEVIPGDGAAFARLPHGPKYCEAGVVRLPGVAFVREESRSRWEDEDVSADADGVTRRCSFGDKVKASEQQIVVNTEKMPYDGLRSIALHELGHALGLGHSCVLDSRRASQVLRACENLDRDDPYRVAVMYPALELRGGSVSDSNARLMVKEALRANDMDRAYCLYRAAFKNDPYAETGTTAGPSGSSGTL